jgi:hypothetical protein
MLTLLCKHSLKLHLISAGRGEDGDNQRLLEESQDLDENEKSKPFAIVIGFVRPPLEGSPRIRVKTTHSDKFLHVSWAYFSYRYT